ncbi:MAG: hypothetical protein ACHQXA_03850 [Gemmatimonadales bacterium]
MSALVACDHVAPGAPSASGNGGPFDPRPPLRLTFNPGNDLWPAWTPDGSGIWYAYQALDRPDGDYCLGRIPAGGGTRTVEACILSPAAAADSVDAVVSPATRGLELAWIRLNSPLHALVPNGGDLVVAPVADPGAAVSLLHFPFQSVTGRFHSFGVDLQWLDDTTLVYAGVAMRVIGNPPRDTVLTGQEIALVRLNGATTIAPNTAGASSVGVGLLPGEIYFTRDGDSRIFHLRLPDTTISIAYDFGALGIARDVRVSASGILAVVGGDVSIPPGAGQFDRGGAVYLLRDTVVTLLTPPPALPFWRHPSFAPNGRSFAGSAHDSTGSADDIYRVDLQ